MSFDLGGELSHASASRRLKIACSRPALLTKRRRIVGGLTLASWATRSMVTAS